MIYRVIYKYPVTPGTNVIVMPVESQFLSVGVQGNQIVVWAVVQSRRQYVQNREIEVVMTGESMDFDPADYNFLGTVTDSRGLVFHVFANKV